MPFQHESVLTVRRVVFAIVSLAFLSACEGSSDHPERDKSATVLEGTLWDDSGAGCTNTAKRLQAAAELRKMFEEDPAPDSTGAALAYYKRAAIYLTLANPECFSQAQEASAQKEFNAIPSKTLKEDVAAGEQ